MNAITENIFSVYVHTNKINNMKYVGITSMFPSSRRWGKDGSGYSHGQYKFYDAIQKYGWNKFNHEVLYTELTEQEALDIEECLINKYDSVNNGYNTLTTGKINYLTDEAKEKLRIQRYGEDNPNFNPNRKHKYRYEKRETPDGITIEKILNYTFPPEETSTDCRKSLEFKQKQKELKTGKNNPNYGKKTWSYGKQMTKEQRQRMKESYTDERKEFIRQRHLGKNNPQAKSVLCKTTNCVYDTIVEAAKSNNISERSVSDCCNKRINSVKGLVFCFQKEGD